MTTEEIENPRDNWTRYIRSPAEQADFQVRNFPHRTLEPLVSKVGLSENDRLLNLGGGVGVIANHLSAQMGTESEVVLADSEEKYLRADLPSSLVYESNVRRRRVDYRSLPFESSSFDIVLLVDFLKFFSAESREGLLEEVQRVMKSDGELVVLEVLERVGWHPSDFDLPEEEQERLDRFETLRREGHEAMGTRLFKTFDNLPRWLESRRFEVRSVGGWFLPTRLNDSHWTDRQKTDLINLRHQARRDRVEVLRQVLNAIERWEPEYASLLRQFASDCQQWALRKRKALESDRETGWSGVPMVLVRARSNSGND